MPQHLPEPGFASAEDRADCRELIRHGSRSFYAASWLLPVGVRRQAYALYAFCRLSDDAVDVDGGRPGAVARLQERLARVYDGRPLPIAADRAMADVVATAAIPRALPEALLEGLDWDARGREYEDLPDLYAYATRVAGTVGAMMALLMGVRCPDALSRACDLGIAMQLTNIARDVGEDARAGRLYLPRRWLREAGVDPDAWLIAPDPKPAVAAVVQRLLVSADQLYARAESGIAVLPRACRPAIQAARLIYAEIGREVERSRCDSVSGRATVSTRRKLRLLGRALADAAVMRAREAAPAVAEARFLVQAAATPVASPSAAASRPSATAWWNFSERYLWVINLFEQLERREQAVRSSSRP